MAGDGNLDRMRSVCIFQEDSPTQTRFLVPLADFLSELCGKLFLRSRTRRMEMKSMKVKFLPLALFVLILIAAPCLQAQTPPFDLVITNGHIIDGTGSPWYSGDVGIRDAKIAAIGNLSTAPRKRTIDAAGKVVAPGFIDMLGQSELTILVDPRLPSKIFQGITSEITGEGNSIAPLNDAIIHSDRSGYEHYKITPDWRTL